MQRISAQQAQQLIREGAAVLDVRSAAEYTQGHLPGAINLPLDEISRANLVIPDRNRPTILYCGSGIRSARAAAVLTAGGWTRIYNLGPITAWPGPLV